MNYFVTVKETNLLIINILNYKGWNQIITVSKLMY